MTPWIKVCPFAEMVVGKLYFIGRSWQSQSANMDLLLCGKNGKLIWGGKPGIAVRCRGGDTLRADILRMRASSREGFIIELIEIPADADKRWRARK